MSHWEAGQKITTDRINIFSAEAEDVNSSTTTSTTFTDTSTGAFSVAVVVPESGAVWVHLRSTQRNNGANNTITHFDASGSVSGSVYGASTVASLIVVGTNNVSLSLRKRLSGLSPGETLTVTSKHRVNTASTGIFDYRYLSVEGVP